MIEARESFDLGNIYQFENGDRLHIAGKELIYRHPEGYFVYEVPGVQEEIKVLQKNGRVSDELYLFSYVFDISEEALPIPRILRTAERLDVIEYSEDESGTGSSTYTIRERLSVPDRLEGELEELVEDVLEADESEVSLSEKRRGEEVET